jgi:hypothetical protein
MAAPRFRVPGAAAWRPRGALILRVDDQGIKQLLAGLGPTHRPMRPAFDVTIARQCETSRTRRGGICWPGCLEMAPEIIVDRLNLLMTSLGAKALKEINAANSR